MPLPTLSEKQAWFTFLCKVWYFVKFVDSETFIICLLFERENDETVQKKLLVLNGIRSQDHQVLHYLFYNQIKNKKKEYIK